MALRRSRSSARLRANRVPHVPRALSHSANLLMVPRMQALITRLSRRACRSACKNKDRGKELFLSNMVGSAGGRFSQQGRSSVAQDEDVLGREAKARKLFVVELSDPRRMRCLPGSSCARTSLRTRLDLAFSALAGR